MALLGLPGAAATVQTDDAVTRTFDVLVVAEVEMKEPTGIYDPNYLFCPFAVFGQRVAVPSVTYYQTARTTTNLRFGEAQIFPGDEIPLGTCPLPGPPLDPVTLVVGTTNLYAPRSDVTFDQLLCIQEWEPLCFPDPTESRAVVSHCNKDNAAFVPSPPDFKGAFTDLDGNALAGSRSIVCLHPDSTYAFKDSVTYYDDGPSATSCQWFFFTFNQWGTDFCSVQVEDTVPLGNGLDDTGYLVTCMETTALVIDLSVAPAVTYLQTFRSHDYLLVLDLDGTPETWLSAQFQHLNPFPSSGTLPLQGWHDVGGKNGFPCPDGDPPPNRKIDDLPVLPTPLSPKKAD